MFDSPWHWLVVIIVALVLFFGWKQLPDMARSLGRSLRVFKTEIKGMSEDDKARDTARDAGAAQTAADPAPRAIDAGQVQPQKELPRADVVKNAPASRPRPTPQGSAARAESRSANQ